MKIAVKFSGVKIRQNICSKRREQRDMIYGYARVSTKKQLAGNGLEVQEKAFFMIGYRH